MVHYLWQIGNQINDKLKARNLQQESINFERERRLKIVENETPKENISPIVVCDRREIQLTRDSVIDELIDEAYQEIEKLTTNFEKIKGYASKLCKKGQSKSKQLLVKANELKDQIIWNHQYIEKLESSKSNNPVTKDEPISDPILSVTEQNQQENVIYLKTSLLNFSDFY
ncbi:MAG: hypothetical protein AB8G05_21475 [Oligoflexales bacterium]